MRETVIRATITKAKEGAPASRTELSGQCLNDFAIIPFVVVETLFFCGHVGLANEDETIIRDRRDVGAQEASSMSLCRVVA